MLFRRIFLPFLLALFLAGAPLHRAMAGGPKPGCAGRMCGKTYTPDEDYAAQSSLRAAIGERAFEMFPNFYRLSHALLRGVGAVLGQPGVQTGLEALEQASYGTPGGADEALFRGLRRLPGVVRGFDEGAGVVAGIGAGGLRGAEEAVGAMHPRGQNLWRYESFDEFGKATNRARKSVSGPGLVTKTSADMTRRGGLGRGIAYNEQIQLGGLYDTSGEALKGGEAVGNWLEMTTHGPAFRPTPGKTVNVREMMFKGGGRYQVTYRKAGWKWNTSMENPTRGVHSSRYDRPGDIWSSEGGVGFLGPTRVDEAVVVDTLTGETYLFK